MSLYCCDYCGGDECFFPKVFLSINTTDKIYPYYNTLFENKYNEISKGIIKDPNRDSYRQVWDAFYLWMMRTQRLEFCSIECAINYLKENPDGGIK